MLIGYAGTDPDVRYYEPDQAVAQVRFATTERGYTLKNGTQVPDHTDWHNLVFYHGLAKVVEQYVRKGDRLYVDGRIRYRQYDDAKGNRRFVTDIIVENMEMLSAKQEAQSQQGAVGSAAPSSLSASPSQAASASTPSQASSASTSSQAASSLSATASLDEVPF